MDAKTQGTVHHRRRWPRRFVYFLGTIIVLLVALRLALPSLIRNQINDRLADIPGYRGHLDHVTLSLWRGAYALNGLSIFKRDGERESPFFSLKRMDLSLAWRDLLHGKFVSDIVMVQPELIIAQGPTPESTQDDTDRRWQAVLEDIVPIDIQHFKVEHGIVRYIDDTKSPRVDLFLKNMQLVATGLKNRPEETDEEFPAKIQAQGDTLGEGRLNLLVEAEPLAAQPHFHLSFKLTGLNLPALNESMRAMANVEVKKGVFDLVVEMAGKDGAFQGYVKPFFTDLDFKVNEEKRGNPLAHLWEKIVSGVAWLVKNKDRDQVATRVPFQGEFGDPQIGLWATIRNLFRHGFVRAFNPVVEGSVDPDEVPPADEVSGRAGPAAKREAQEKLERKNDEAAEKSGPGKTN